MTDLGLTGKRVIVTGAAGGLGRAFALADHPGIFSRLAGALALVGANVVDARTYTSKDGYATAVFWVQDSEGKPYEVSRLPRLRNMIDKTLKGEVMPRQALADRDGAALGRVLTEHLHHKRDTVLQLLRAGQAQPLLATPASA